MCDSHPWVLGSLDPSFQGKPGSLFLEFSIQGEKLPFWQGWVSFKIEGSRTPPYLPSGTGKKVFSTQVNDTLFLNFDS